MLLALLQALLPARAEADPVSQLMRILASASDYKQRLTAAIGLARYRDRRSVPALIKALKDPNHTVRGTVAGVLGTFGDQRARPPLEALLLGTKDSFVRGQAQKALAALMALAEGKKPGGAGGRMQLHGILGTLDQQAIQEGVNARLPQATGCYSRQLETAPYIGGKIDLKFRVATDGKVKWVRIWNSDLGSLDAEQCITREMMNATFDAPDGGEAEFSIPLTFGGGDTATALDPRSEVARRLQRSCKKLLRVGKRRLLVAPPGLQVGLYIDTYGTVVSAGLAADVEIPADFAQEFIGNLKRLELQEPSFEGRFGKLVYRFACGP